MPPFLLILYNLFGDQDHHRKMFQIQCQNRRKEKKKKLKIQTYYHEQLIRSDELPHSWPSLQSQHQNCNNDFRLLHFLFSPPATRCLIVQSYRFENLVNCSAMLYINLYTLRQNMIDGIVVFVNLIVQYNLMTNHYHFP